jgi:GxxExxY protein
MALQDEELTKEILGAAIEVHRFLGPGLLENAYRRCLAHELGLRGLVAGAEVVLDLEYKGLVVPATYRLDLLVEDRVVVEVKTVDSLTALHRAQLLTYLRLSGTRIGLLLNFKVERMADGIRRVVR